MEKSEVIIRIQFGWIQIRIFRLNRPQPDNRMFGETNGRVDEACIAVLNDHYDVRNIFDGEMTYLDSILFHNNFRTAQSGTTWRARTRSPSCARKNRHSSPSSTSREALDEELPSFAKCRCSPLAPGIFINLLIHPEIKYSHHIKSFPTFLSTFHLMVRFQESRYTGLGVILKWK